MNENYRYVNETYKHTLSTHSAMAIKSNLSEAQILKMNRPIIIISQ